MTSDDAVREAFEAWAKSDEAPWHPDLIRWHDILQRYPRANIQVAFLAYAAGRRAGLSEAEEVCKSLPISGYEYALDRCAAAIRALGENNERP